MSAAFYLVQSGEALRLVKKHIADADRVRSANWALVKELGVEEIFIGDDGVIKGLRLPAGDAHPEFTKADRRDRSYPKRGTSWEGRFSSLQGYDREINVIQRLFGVPTSVEYVSPDGSGSSALGDFHDECGWLYLSREGPYAVWIPDVAAEVAKHEALGRTVKDPAKTFSMVLEGCRRIDEEEWEILVAQHELDEKRARRAERVAAENLAPATT